MVFTLGLVIFLIGIAVYKFRTDVEAKREMKQCDVEDADYCLDCRHWEKCTKNK